jgi:hypothetical protein
MSRKKIESALMAFTSVTVFKLGPEASWTLAEETYVARSGVFAVYCAHGFCPVVLSRGDAPSGGLQAGQYYLPSVPTCDADKAQQVGEGAWGLHQLHGVASHVANLRQFLDVPTQRQGGC